MGEGLLRGRNRLVVRHSGSPEPGTMRELQIMSRALDLVAEMFENAESAKSERNFESPETPAGV